MPSRQDLNAFDQRLSQLNRPVPDRQDSLPATALAPDPVTEESKEADSEDDSKDNSEADEQNGGTDIAQSDGTEAAQKFAHAAESLNAHINAYTIHGVERDPRNVDFGRNLPIDNRSPRAISPTACQEYREKWEEHRKKRRQQRRDSSVFTVVRDEGTGSGADILQQDGFRSPSANAQSLLEELRHNSTPDDGHVDKDWWKKHETETLTSDLGSGESGKSADEQGSIDNSTPRKKNRRHSTLSWSPSKKTYPSTSTLLDAPTLVDWHPRSSTPPSLSSAEHTRAATLPKAIALELGGLLAPVTRKDPGPIAPPGLPPGIDLSHFPNEETPVCPPTPRLEQLEILDNLNSKAPFSNCTFLPQSSSQQPASRRTQMRSDNMQNNFSNFDPLNQGTNNAPRQAPNAQQAQQQINGLNGSSHWPNVGAQADMNVLWEYIQNLSQMHEGIRAQTQHVLNGVQQIQARAGSSPTGEVMANGIGASQPNPQQAEIARLQNELSAANSRISDLTDQTQKLASLNTDYESSLTLLMEKLRPFAAQHNSALLSQKAHYLRLIEDERQQNLDLRLEQSRWQESLGRLNENLRMALIVQTEAELPYLRKIVKLKGENKTLRRICGVPPLEESDEEEEGQEGEGGDVAGLGQRPNLQVGPEESGTRGRIRMEGQIGTV